MDPSSISPQPSSLEQRLDRYLAGAGTPAELAALRRQLQRDGISVAALDAARQHFDDLGGQRTFVAAERARLLERVRQSSETAATHVATARRFPSAGGLGRGLSLTCLAMAVLGLGIWASRHDARGKSESTQHRYATAVGQRATVTFADGSRATLGPATHMTVRSDDHQLGTVITLDGEAVFTVAPNAHAPFSVHAGRSITRVLGTTFLVRRYATDREARVVVQEGRLSIADARALRESRVLNAGSLGFISDSGTVRVIDNTEDAIGLSVGTLRFDNTPLYDVAAELSRAYGVEIHVSDSALAAQRAKWNVQTTRTPLNQALEQLPLLFDVRVVRSGQIITLVPGRAPTRMPVRPSRPFIVEPQHGR